MTLIFSGLRALIAGVMPIKQDRPLFFQKTFDSSISPSGLLERLIKRPN